MSSATTPTVVSIATMPTSMTDVEATRLGLKAYSHGTSYNGSIAPTITLNSGGGTLTTVDVSQFIPYQLQDGTWRLKFNVSVTLSTVSRTEAGLAINGVTFPTAYAQSISGWSNQQPAIGRGKAQTGNFFLEHAALSTATYYYHGDVILASKPTWSY